MSNSEKKWRKISSEIIHKNPHYTVYQDKVIKPDGSEGTYQVVKKNPSAFIVAMEEDQLVHLIKLHRYPNDIFSIEVPAGGTDGENPLVAAKRELQEETGLTAKSWKELGIVYPANGILQQKNYMYLATGLKQTGKHQQEEEGITQTMQVPFAQALSMIKNREITDAETITALSLAALELGMLKP